MEKLLSDIPVWLQIALAVAINALAARYAVTAIGYIFSKITGGLLKLEQKINETKLGALAKADDMLIAELQSVVLGVQDSIVDKLKAASEDGKLSREEAEAVMKIAVERFKRGLGQVKWDLLQKQLGADLEALIRAKLPGLVATMKKLGLLPTSKEVKKAADPQ